MSTDRRLAAAAVLLLIAAACSDGYVDSTAPSTPNLPVTSTTTTTVPTTTTLALPEPQRVDDVLAECPSPFDVDYVLGRFDLVFEGDPTAPVLVCEESDGSADLTRLQERTVQALLMMEATTFEEPLPWTDLQLLDWLDEAIDGIRFRDDIDTSFCCDPEGYVNLQTGNLAAVETTRWIDPVSGTGLIDLIALVVHEARHAEGPVHTCDDGANDETTAEMGAWAVEAFLYRWYADHADQTFFDDPDRSGYYSRTAADDARRILDTRICESGG